MSVSLKWCKYEHTELSINFELFNDECAIVKEAQDATADPGDASAIPARSHTFVEISHKIFCIVIPLSSADHSRRVVVSLSEIMSSKYWLSACSSLPRKKCG